MPKRIKVGITLTEETIKRLEEICQITGMEKSYAISLAINSYVLNDENYKKLREEKYREK